MRYTEAMGSPPTPLAERIWVALQALPRDETGKREADVDIERNNNLNKGLLYKLVHGRQKSVDARALVNLASALRVSERWLERGEGAAPVPSGPPEAPWWASAAEAIPDVDLALEYLRRAGRRISAEAEARVRRVPVTTTRTVTDWSNALIDAQAALDKETASPAPPPTPITAARRLERKTRGPASRKRT
jgi:hypothetical protein